LFWDDFETLFAKMGIKGEDFIHADLSYDFKTGAIHIDNITSYMM